MKKKELRFENRKKILACMLSGVVLMSAILGEMSCLASEGSRMGENGIPQNGLIADYSFAEEPSDGKTITNQAKGDATVGDAVIQNESTAVWDDNALVFSGEGNSVSNPTGTWVALPENILAGKSSATITIEARAAETMLNSYHFLWNIGNTGTNTYWFMNMKEPRATIKYSGSEKSAIGSSLTVNRWYSLTAVIDAENQTLSYYIDGRKAAEVKDSGMSLEKISDQSRNTIGLSPYNDVLFKGAVSSFRVYDRALTEAEVKEISAADAFLHKDVWPTLAGEVTKNIKDVTITNTRTVLPDYNGMVKWSSKTDAVVIAENGLTAEAKQPAEGEAAVTGTLTANLTLRGQVYTKDVKVTIQPKVADDSPYGYLMVHFMQDGSNYTEKIYLDITRENNPEYWDPLNGGEPVLVSNIGTTGVRDPFLTYNPETKKHYIIGTDLRAVGGDPKYNNSWGEWSRIGSVKMNIWESSDLIHWSEQRQFDVSLDKDGNKACELGMMWAPEATWVPDYYEEGKGAFVVYWSSTIYEDTDTQHEGPGKSSRIMWGATTDFTQETWEFGGEFIERGSAGCIDTTITQNGDKTYHITKSHAEGIIMEVTTDKKWWLPEAKWERVQSQIGSDIYGGVEGAAVFKDHGRENHWYLFVDAPSYTGYQLLESNDLDKGWVRMDSDSYFLTKNTRHGGVCPLTKGEYDAIRAADVKAAAKEDLGTIEIAQGATEEEVIAALPKTAEAVQYYGLGTSEVSVEWDIEKVNTENAGNSYEITGTLSSVGANFNQWVGDNGSTAWNAPNKKLYSSTVVTVKATVVVKEKPAGLPFEDVKEDDWFYNQVSYNYFEGTMTGKDPTHFAPAETLVRAQFAAVLHKMNKEPHVAYTNVFSDVTAGDWFTDAVLWAAENKIVTGYTGTKLFGANDNVTREQMATMMYRYAKEYKEYEIRADGDCSTFPDAGDIQEFAKEAMKWAVGNGIITGKTVEGRLLLDPQGSANRAECATIIQRFMEKYER